MASSARSRADPVLRAVNTFMYGLVVHFGCVWIIQATQDREMSGVPPSFSENDNQAAQTSPGYFLTTIFLHEYWVFLQHANVFGNPHLQHLDRQYGIALLQSNKHWSIAGTLAGYWMRETIGMFLCLPFLSSPSRQGLSFGFSASQYMILYSLVYHTIKSRGVRSDALNRSSSKFGIMRLVIDNFHSHSSAEFSISALRLFLQGFDAFIHFYIVRDLMLLHKGVWFISMHFLWGVWVLHACMNQLFRCSTATIMVNAWQSIAAKEKCVHDVVMHEDEDCTSETDSTQSSERTPDAIEANANDSDFIVRHLLQKNRVPTKLRGRQGKASEVVDKAVRLETAMTVLALFFMLGLGETPLKGLVNTVECLNADRDVVDVLLFSWLLSSLLHGLWSTFLRSKGRLSQSMQAVSLNYTSPAKARQRSFIIAFDLSVLIGIANFILPKAQDYVKVLPICALVTAKSYIHPGAPRLVRKGLVTTEFGMKLLLLRSIDNVQFAGVSTCLAACFILWTVFCPSPTPCEDCQITDDEDGPADAVFLGHPALLTDAWALWLLPYSLDERWKTPRLSLLLWPFHYVVGLYVCKYRRRLFGERSSFFCCDDVYYDQVRMQNWVAAHFGRHFVTNPSEVKANIEAAARHAEKTGVRVVCLGALNKAESINGGGDGVAKALGPNRRISLIHGNHLTAAAVVETVHQVFAGHDSVKLFLTGASSKVGWAVARALRDRHGYELLCHSTDSGRRRFFEENGFASASSLKDGVGFSPFWIVGKYDVDVAKLIPQGATAIVFSVPHPLLGRKDVRVIEAATLHIDMKRLDRPRVFTNKLKREEIFACHAASVVAAHRLDRGASRITEVGAVDPGSMDEWLHEAKALGFTVPRFEPVPVKNGPPAALCCGKPTVCIIGAGPSGLTTAAYLKQRNIPTVILEAEEDPSVFGSWTKHFAGLEITTQRKWCNLPGLPVGDRDDSETITGLEYQRYLKLYSDRFGLEIRRGVRVHDVEKGSHESPYKVKYTCSGGKDGEMVAWAVVVATGKHRTPNRNTIDDLASKLDAHGIKHIHSTDLKDDAAWDGACQAAGKGRLCIVGFGNSASDICSNILRQRCAGESGSIHIAARTVPPVFPRRRGFLRIDTIGYLMRMLPSDMLVKALSSLIPSSLACDRAFPAHLPRWKRIRGRVPVIDKFDVLASSFESGSLVGHGPIFDVSDDGVKFSDNPGANSQTVKIDLVVLATGYKTDCLVGREDRLNGLYKCGFAQSDRFLPIRTICEEAKMIADDILSNYHTDIS